MINNIRFDLSEYLIHFFREINIHKDYVDVPEYIGFNNIYEDNLLHACFLLRCTLRNNKLPATWSYRNNQRTIYGKKPAICFTDMPIAAFIEASRKRLSQGELVGEYAFLIPKDVMFNLGARPVIYGLTEKLITYEESSIPNERIIDKSLLPYDEQYRYVTYNRKGNRLIDWTHEREWRWASNDDLTNYYKELESGDGIENFETLPGLNLSLLLNAGILVPKKEEIKKILHDILTLVDSKIIDRNSFRFILHSENLDFKNIIYHEQLNELINNNTININSYFNYQDELIDELNKDIDSIIKQVLSEEALVDPRENGQAYIWFINNDSNLVRALVLNNRILINKEGKYLLRIHEIKFKSLREQEDICKRISKELNRKYNIQCTYYSILQGINPIDINSVPYYTDFQNFRHPYYNWNDGYYK
ncbi:DUF4427 domain-containing protein [Aliarcobacter skirrowii]|uniref:DUF4427 domain-containing protein n=1 Tax=Aliarcobacter skirrowii TaxID=28200 RepID=UPI000835A770|nr:DUF4427 domain-containing protein [Aliarcobacter skirrowii]